VFGIPFSRLGRIHYDCDLNQMFGHERAAPSSRTRVQDDLCDIEALSRTKRVTNQHPVMVVTAGAGSQLSRSSKA